MKHIFSISRIILVFSTLCFISCKEQPSLPVVTTNNITDKTPTSATTGGYVTSDGGAEVTARGVCWTAFEANPTTGSDKTTDSSGTGSFTSHVTGLTGGINYYVRAYATNEAGTSYGNEVSFITPVQDVIIFNPNLTYDTMSDIDGNTYQTIQIGTQTWMAENLKTTRLNDGTAIPLVTGNTEWAALTAPGFCWYFDNNTMHGAYYNWYTVNTGKLCPSEWHVSTYEDWLELSSFLGGADVAGGKLKETSTIHWISPNTGATNESGFTAIASAFRNIYGTFEIPGWEACWWTPTESGALQARFINIINNSSYLFGGDLEKEFGFSVRCVKD